MKRIHFNRQTIRNSIAVSAVVLLITAGTWHARAAGTGIPTPNLVSQTVSELTRSVGRGRDSYADVVAMVAPAVVTIRTEVNAQISPANLPDHGFFPRFFGDQSGNAPGSSRGFRQHGLGSGVIVSADGYVLTNDHVVDGAEDIRVDLSDGRTVKAKVIGADPPSDLALLKIDATNLRALALGDSDAVRVGDVVLAIGNPLGVGQTVTMGIISAKGRSTGVGDGSYEDFLQTDAPINQGNSGGALVNTKGELIGINSQIMSTSTGNIGIGFAIPSNLAGHVMPLLRSEGRVRRGRLGVTVQPVTSDLAEALGLKEVGGAVVNSVEAGSPAARAGVERGDIITSFNGRPVRDANTLRNRVADAAPGSQATLVVSRNGVERHLTARLGEVPSQVARRAGGTDETNNDAKLGVSAEPLTPQLASQAGVSRDIRGLLVEGVSPNGRAADAGVQPGDVIEEVNRQPVRSVDDLRRAMREGSERPVLLLINRAGRDLFATARAS